MICIKNGTIHTAVKKETFKGDILIQNGKILQIGTDLDGQADQVIQAEGLEVYPGFIDAHCHVGLDVFAGGSMGMEFNETNDPVTPQLSAVDGFNPFR